jgi:glutamine---fructose-6-phosphate transaminase (isomerizing)
MMTTLMRQEIGEIPEVVARVLDGGSAATGEAAAAIAHARPRSAVIVARGTSDHAAIYARYLLETHVGLQTGLAAASVTTLYRARLDWHDTLLLAFSQSGQSPDISSVTASAREGGALTLAITNDPASPLAKAAEHTLECLAGAERAVAATKTYVAELAAVAALVGRLAPDTPLAASLRAVPSAIGQAVVAGEAWVGRDGFVDELAGSDSALVVSRGFNYATALEVALKLKETSIIFAEGYSTADLLHGPVALAGPAVPFVVFRPDGPVGRAIGDELQRARAAGAQPWTVGGRDLANDPWADRALVLDDGLPEALTPLTYVVPGQLLAEAVSRRRGLDPDAPVGLTKVTRTR